MSAPVNVLALLRDPHYDLRCAADFEAAADIVAELVEAATRVNGDHTAPHDCYATGPMTGNPIADLIACPGCALSAALARVKGGAT